MFDSKQILDVKNRLIDFEKRIEEMHLDFQKYRYGQENKLPDWDTLELELITFSKRKLMDIELTKQLDRILYKFQNRKKIWLQWVEEYHHSAE